MTVTVYGADFSVYTRSVRMALHEKKIAYSMETVDPFEGDIRAHLKRHPFGKIPVLDWDGFQVYETTAILRYIEARVPSPTLLPPGAKDHARVDQILSILDSYGFRSMVWGVYVEGTEKLVGGETVDADVVKRGLRDTRRLLKAVVELAGPGPYLVGDTVSLADLHFVSMITYLKASPDGAAIFRRDNRLVQWWDAVSKRDSVAATRYPNEMGE